MTQLFNDLVDAIPIDFDFGTGYGEQWSTVYPSQDADLLVLLDYLEDNQELDAAQWWHGDESGWMWRCEGQTCHWHLTGKDCPVDERADSWEEIEAALREQFRNVAMERPEDFEPAMNYAYPCPSGDGAEIQAKLIDSMLCVVEVDGGYFLALQAGGMDLSWEICATYVSLGYLPPTHFCDLPQMAGRGESDPDKSLAAICVRSLEMSAAWKTNAAERVRELAGLGKAVSPEAL